MPKISPHFDQSELACHCCGFYNLDPRMLFILEKVRLAAGTLMMINSGCRCTKHNAEVGGGPEHPEGKAVDICCKLDTLRHSILKTAYELNIPRIGIAETFIHLGISTDCPQNVTWTYPPKKGSEA